VIDESLLGGSFVAKVREHWWPEYSWRKFFWFNTGYFIVMFGSVVIYDRLGGAFVILPLAWCIERFCNSIWHVWWSLHFREYSPGLLSCVLIWMDTYFVVFYRSAQVLPGTAVLSSAFALGLLYAAFLAFYIPLIRGRVGRHDMTALPRV
jgi:hypothetical protein